MIHITDTLALADREVAERFVRATGPHGQNANRDATAVELRVDLSASSLPVDVKQRLRAHAGRHVTRDDVLVVVSSVFRSQIKNREGARARLVGLLKRAAHPRCPRSPTQPPQAERDRRLQSKHRRGAVKRARDTRNGEQA